MQGRRHFLFLFDLANSYPRGIFRARKAAREVVRTMHPSDLVAVGLYDQIQGLKFVLGFTSDRDQVDIALDSFGFPGLFHPVNDPLQLSLATGRGRAAATSPGPGREAALAADLSLEAEYRISEAITALEEFEAIERIERMTEDFDSMARGLAAVQGQVHLVYFSEGPGAGSMLGGPISDETRDDLERGRIWNVSSSRYGSTRALNAFEGMIESLRRAGTIVHSVDVGGLRTAGSVLHRPGNPDALNAIAQDTGGELYDNFNDLSAAMGLILEATSVTYLATIQPQTVPMDGEYRKLKVRLKDSPGWGTKVSHRAGFFAPRPFALADSVEKQLTAAQLILGEDETGTLGLEALAAVVPVTGEKPQVTLRLELPGPSLTASRSDQPQRQLQLSAYAFDDAGRIHDFFNKLVDLDLDKLGSELRRTGLKYSSPLDLDPGHYRVRVLVRDLASGEYGVRTAEVTVDPGGTTRLPVMAAHRLESQNLAASER